MANFRFSAFANRILPSVQSVTPQGGFSSAIRPSSAIILDQDMNRLTWSSRLSPRSLGLASSHPSARSVSAVPLKPSTKPPTLEQFDPLNPGEWQVGAGGKILPRLPEGTRVGKLMMGKYGLYSPRLRKRVEAFSTALDHGAWSEWATPWDRKLTMLAYFGAACCAVLTVWNYWLMLTGELHWPAKKKE